MSHPIATPQDVRDITGSSADDTEIQPFLDTAHLLVTKVEGCAKVSDDVLTQADAYLCAHLMAIMGQGGVSVGGVTSESIESQSITYMASSVSGSGTMSTPYGQTANLLLNGCLSTLDGKKSAICFTGGA